MSGLQPSPDPELEALRAEVTLLQAQLSELGREREGVEQRIRAFTRRQVQELGELGRRLLAQALRKAEEAFGRDPSEENRQALEQARGQQASFEASQSADPVVATVYALSESEADELKRAYRTAVRLCHPDLVADALKPHAREVCQALIRAYKQNDLLTVTEMLCQLQTEGLSGTRPPEADEVGLWRRRADLLRQRLDREQVELNDLRGGSAFQTLEAAGDLDAYFAAARTILEAQLEADDDPRADEAGGDAAGSSP